MWDMSQFPRPLPKPEFDELKLYYAKPYQVTDKITIHQPTVGEIIDYGEQEYYSIVHNLTCTPTDMKVDLFDKGINYMEMTDFDLFCSIYPILTKDKTQLFFGDLDFTKFEYGYHKITQEPILYSVEQDIIIDRELHNKIAWYIREINNITPKFELAGNKRGLKMMINRDRERQDMMKDKTFHSQLKPLISAMMRYPAFKYKKDELIECGIYEFMDCVVGAQIYVSSTALMQGSYSGMIDTSKINQREFNWMRGLNDKEYEPVDTGFTVQKK